MVDPVLNICAALSVQSPFTQKAHRDYDAMTSRKSLESEHGDPVTLLNAFDEWMQVAFMYYNFIGLFLRHRV